MFEQIKAYFKRVLQIINLWNQKRIKGIELPVVDNDKEHICKNCGVSFFGRYCFNCGQSSHIEKLTWKWVVSGLFSGLTSASNGFGNTILELFYRPGYMISDFIKGKRVIYSGPFQSLFVLAAIYLFASFLIDFVNQDASKNEEKPRTETPVSYNGKSAESTVDELYNSKIKEDPNETEIMLYKDSIIILERRKDTLKQVLEKNISDSVDIQKEITKINEKIDAFNSKITEVYENSSDAFENFIGDLYDKFKSYKAGHPFFISVVNLFYDWLDTNKALSSILGLPFVALAISWAFRRNKNGLKYNFTEMLFVGCYLSCQNVIISLVVLCTGLENSNSMAILSWIILPFWTLKELFGNSIWKTTIKILLYYLYIILIAILIIILICLIATILIAIFYKA